MNPESPFKVTVLPLSDHPDNFTYAITGTADHNWELGTERFPTGGEAAVADAAALEGWITTSMKEFYRLTALSNHLPPMAGSKF